MDTRDTYLISMTQHLTFVLTRSSIAVLLGFNLPSVYINFLIVMCIQLHVDMHTIICNINLHLLSAVVSIS